MTQQTDDLEVSPNATDRIFKFGFEIKFGSSPLYTNPFLIAPSRRPSKHATRKYLKRLNALGFTKSEQAIILKLRLDWGFHTKWPAFHWDVDALESNARDWAGSGDEVVFDVNADASLLKWVAYCEKEMEAVVSPEDSTGLSRSRSNSVVVVPDRAEGSDELSTCVFVPAAVISDEVKGEDIPRYGTPDFKILHSSPSELPRPNVTVIPTRVPLPLSRSGSEDSSSSSEYSESAFYDRDLDLDFDSGWYWSWLHSFSEFTWSSSSFGFTMLESDPEQSDSGPAPVEIEETEMQGMIGSSLVTLLDLDEESEESFDQEDDDEKPVLVYSSSNHEDVDISLSPEAGFGFSNPDITLVEEPTSTPMDPVKLSKLTQLSTIPVAGDPSLLLLLSTLPIPPLPEFHSQDQPKTRPSSQFEMFKRDPESCTKLEIMDGQGAITNEVGAQLRCGCDECRPVAMKALFGDWCWPLDVA